MTVFVYTYENNHHVVSVAELEGRGCESHEIVRGTAELHLSGLIGTESHPDMRKIRIIGFFKFYSHQLMHFFTQLCISLLSYIKIT